MSKLSKICLIFILSAMVFFGSTTMSRASENSDQQIFKKIKIFKIQKNDSYNFSSQIPSLLLSRDQIVVTAEGKGVCSDRHDRPSVSKKKDYNHMDEDCCPDFDEWSNPGCAYSQGDLGVMLKGPRSGHAHRK